jgi:FHS family L-fucose permease-like MFS transporter
VGQYWFFLLALFVIASGLSFLETASNPFIAQMGSQETSEQRLNFAQAFNPLGAITGVLIGKIYIFSGIELRPDQISAMQAGGTYKPYLTFEILRVVKPYLFLGAAALLWAVLILIKKFPPIRSEHEDSNDSGNFMDFFHSSFQYLDREYGLDFAVLLVLPWAIARFLHLSELIKFGHFRRAVLAQFMYVGAQVGTWSYFIQYVQDYTHQPEKAAANYLIYTLVAFGIGRFASTALMRVVRPNLLMGIFAVINILLVAAGVLHPGWVGVWTIMLTSFFMSLMFPTIFALGIKGLGPNTKIGGSLIIMAIVGGAALTPLMGLINDGTHSIALAYLVPLVGYAVVALYAFFGSHVRAFVPAED